LAELQPRPSTRSLVVGTHNRHKVREIRALLRGIPFEVRSIDELYDGPDVVEDGHTFAENASKKAVEFSKATGELVLADDSGLEVDALDGAPGVRSARYAGPAKSDADNTRKLLDELRQIPDAERNARFRCAIAVADRGRLVFMVDGSVEGQIAQAPRGSGGFGYDPVFFVPSLGKTFAEVPPKVKNRMSHRGQALRKAREKLAEYADKAAKPGDF